MTTPNAPRASDVDAVTVGLQFATTGGQQTPTALGADLAAAARALRIAKASTVRTERELVDALEIPDGPLVVVAKVEESAPIAKPPNDCAAMTRRFMDAIAQP